MYKIRKIKYINHPVLKDLELDFCDRNGHAFDTIILAGENGTGKSTILNTLYSISTYKADFEAIVEFEIDKLIATINFHFRESSNGNIQLYASDGTGLNSNIIFPDFKNKYSMTAIFSDVDISFHSGQINSVTSLVLDENKESRRSSMGLSTQIKQLLIDIQALDDADVALAVRTHPDLPRTKLDVDERMPRFTNAFNRMFDGLSYSRIENINGQKVILFSKNGIDIPIDSLSSGEKQIVFRGCFLLKDVYALNGAFVFVDEPEISLHPKWQMKILDYYKSIFTDSNGKQTSQIIAVTHSPFIIHNDNRANDKVIILKRNDNGDIVVNDKPEYYKCNSFEAVRDAFSISDFSEDRSTVYVEGRTDELYFRKALEVFKMTVPFTFKWIGYIDDKNNDVNTGASALDHAFNFLVARNLSVKNVCLYDCDTKKSMINKNNVYKFVVPNYKNNKNIKVGIENALILDSVDMNEFYTIKHGLGDYGEPIDISHFEKMKFCKYICSLNHSELKVIMKNLKEIINSLIELF